MSEKTPRRPSTLSAAKAQAAARPLGASELVRTPAGDVSASAGVSAGLARGPIHQSTRPQPKVLNRPSAQTIGRPPAFASTTSTLASSMASSNSSVASAVPSTAGNSASRTATKAAARVAAGQRESGERRVVVGVISAFLVCAVLLMSMNVVNSSKESKAKETLGQSFAVVHSRQTEYRSMFGRFATWPELEGRGVRLSPNQTVREWNADASHWFISIRDRETGMVCDRTGELFDEDANERQPVCRSLP